MVHDQQLLISSINEYWIKSQVHLLIVYMPNKCLFVTNIVTENKKTWLHAPTHYHFRVFTPWHVIITVTCCYSISIDLQESPNGQYMCKFYTCITSAPRWSWDYNNCCFFDTLAVILTTIICIQLKQKLMVLVNLEGIKLSIWDTSCWHLSTPSVYRYW